MCRRLIKEDVEEILALRKQKMLLKDIATKFKVSDAQISNVIHNIHMPRRLKPPEAKKVNPHAPVAFQEEDFSNLPREVLFKHVKASEFIG